MFIFLMVVVIVCCLSSPDTNRNREDHKEYTIEEMMFYDWLFDDDD